MLFEQQMDIDMACKGRNGGDINLLLIFIIEILFV